MTSAKATERPPTKNILAASLVGTSIEWYDYFLFGTAAALVFGKIFFPKLSSTAGTLASFGTFGVGFAARPLGAIIIGHFGDRIGRKAMLVLTLLLTGGSTFAISLLPTYDAIGVGAPLLLVIVRLVQGFGVGGEWGGAILIATEHASPRRRAIYGSFAQLGVPIGVLTSNLAFLAVTQMSDHDFRSYGWRIPFMISVLLVVLGVAVRSRLHDSPEFEQARVRRSAGRVPFATLVRRQPRNLLLASLASIAPPAIGYTVTVYMLSYGTKTVGFHRTTLLTLILVSTGLWIVAILTSALLADRFGAKAVYTIGAVTAVLLPAPMFALVNTGSAGWGLLAFLLAAVVQGIMAGAQGGLLTEIFGIDMRYSGISIAYQLGGMVGGAVSPLVATALFSRYHSSTPIATYMALLSLVSLIAIPGLRRVDSRAPAGSAAITESTAAVTPSP